MHVNFNFPFILALNSACTLYMSVYYNRIFTVRGWRAFFTEHFFCCNSNIHRHRDGMFQKKHRHRPSLNVVAP